MSDLDYDSSAPSTPFSLVSSLPSDDYFQAGEVSDDEGSQFELVAGDTSDLDWDMLDSTPGSPHPSELDQPAPPSPQSTTFQTPISSRAPSPPLGQPLTRVRTYSTKSLPDRPTTPPILQLPIAHPSATPFTLLRLAGLPQSWTLDNLLSLLVESFRNPGDLLSYEGRIPTPLWISFKPAFSELNLQRLSADSYDAREPSRCRTPTQKYVDDLRATALIRYLNPEDAVSLTEVFEHMTGQLGDLDETVIERWLWLLEIRVELVNDDEVEAGEEAKGAILWASDWLRDDGEDGTSRKLKEPVKDERTTLLVQPLPTEVTLDRLVDLFVTNNSLEKSKPKAVTLLPHLSLHSIFMPCCVLSYGDSVQAAGAEKALSKTIYADQLGPYSFSPRPYRVARYTVEYSLGDWSTCARTIQGAEYWPRPEPKNVYMADDSNVQLGDDTARGYSEEHLPDVTHFFHPTSIERPKQTIFRPERTPRAGTHTCVLMLDLPQDIPLTEIVKVYTTAPVAPVDPASETEASPHGTFNSIPVPVRISLIKPSHPQYSPAAPLAVLSYSPASPFAVLSYASTAAFAGGVYYLPTCLWHLPGDPGAFMRTDQRQGQERVYYVKYSYGSWGSLHGGDGAETWDADEILDESA